MPVWPFDAEIFLDESCPVAIHGFGKLDGVTLALPAGLQPPDLPIKRRVDKYVKGIASALQVVGRAAPNDDALAAFGSTFHHALRDLSDAIGICHLQPRGIQTTFEAASHESPEQPVEDRIPLLFVFLHHSAVALHQPGDFVGQQLIPQLPAQASRDSFRDIGATAPVFALDRNHSDHGSINHNDPSIISLLVHGNPASARLIFLQRERNQEHDRRSNRENPESINVGQGARLSYHCPINHAIGLLRCPVGIRA